MRTAAETNIAIGILLRSQKGRATLAPLLAFLDVAASLDFKGKDAAVGIIHDALAGRNAGAVFDALRRAKP